MTTPHAYQVGDTLWCVPRRGPPHEIKITKVGRKWLTYGDGTYDRVDRTTLRGEQYSDVMYFTSEAAHVEYAARNTTWRFLWDAVYRSYTAPDVSEADIRAAAALLGITIP